MVNYKVLFDFDDLLIKPIEISNISSRKSIILESLPLMTAPMDTVINNENKHYFTELGIIAVLPRIANIDINYISEENFLSYGLNDFENIFLKNTPHIKNSAKVLIDVANGHMLKLYEMSRAAKEKYGDKIELIIGNIANPETYRMYAQIGVDYIRCGIGFGGGCLTSVQTGVGYPMASLINDCRIIKENENFQTKIIADGGFKKYSDIIKALGLGADYVMLGSILNKALESAGDTYQISTLINIPVDQYSEHTKKLFLADTPLEKQFRGMSTKEVQKKWGKEELTTSEGVYRTYKVEYTLSGWVNNFKDYLKSSMSYCGKNNLDEFIGKIDFNFISQNSFKRFNK